MPHMIRELYQQCENIISRLPLLREYEAWIERLDAAQTLVEMQEVANALQQVLTAYQTRYHMDITRGPVVYHRDDIGKKH